VQNERDRTATDIYLDVRLVEMCACCTEVLEMCLLVAQLPVSVDESSRAESMSDRAYATAT